MITSSLTERAERLRGLHRGPRPLVLPNAWDAASARAVAEAGFPAVASTSSGVCASLGWADGEKIPADEMFAAVARMARVVDVPLTADIEGGYRLAPAELVERLLAAGAVGCNLEDTDHTGAAVLREPAAQADYLRAVKAAARTAGVDVVVNARIDVFLRQVGEPADRLPMTLERARLYLQAGADCIFPFGVRDEPTIAALVQGIAAPVNVALLPEAPSLARLGELGVARVSYAGGVFRAVMAEHKRQLESIRERSEP